MYSSLSALISAYPVALVPAGTVLLQRTGTMRDALYIEAGRVALGVAAPPDDDALAGSHAMAHQLGEVSAPAWLEANAVVLDVPSAVDAVAQTELVLRRVPAEEFRRVIAQGSNVTQALLYDIARAHRQQTELAVSRLAKDAEARCAEWLLRQADPAEPGPCLVRLQLHKRAIAAQLGIAPETFSRVLRHLRERSLISGSGRTLNLVDPGGLRSLAGR